MEDVAGLILVKDAGTGPFLAGELPDRVVVIHVALRDFFLRCGDLIVEIEVGAIGRYPMKTPAHALLERLDLRQRRSRNHHHPDVSRGEMYGAGVDMVGNERATRAALFPPRAEHEVI